MASRCAARRSFCLALFGDRPWDTTLYTLPVVSLKVIGIRHGEVHNPKGVIYSGLPGYGLSDAGREQAARAADALRGAGVVALYSSPLERAMETAGVVADALGLEIHEDIRLHEWRYWAQWAGMTWEELRTNGREAWEAYQTDPGSVTSGESLHQLADRVEAWMADVRSEIMHDGIVVGVTHLEPLRAILLRMLGRPAVDLFALEIGLGHAVRLAPTPDASSLDAAALARAFVE
jgi:broad specificity phosphatase PhoE